MFRVPIQSKQPLITLTVLALLGPASCNQLFLECVLDPINFLLQPVMQGLGFRV